MGSFVLGQNNNDFNLPHLFELLVNTANLQHQTLLEMHDIPTEYRCNYISKMFTDSVIFFSFPLQILSTTL